MVEDSTDVERPMQEQLEKYLGEEVTGNLKSKLHRKNHEVVIEHQ